MRWFVTGLVCATMLFFLGDVFGQAGKDQIKFKTGDVWVGVNIESETYLEVKVTGKPVVDPTTIDSIKHGDAPPDYVMAESNLRQGQYEDAIKRLDKAATAKARPWLKHYCAYYKALCMKELAKAEGSPKRIAEAMAKPIAAYQAMIKASPKGIKVPQAKLDIAEAYYLGAKYDEAAKVVAEIAKSDFPAAWKMRGKLLEGRIELAKGDAAKAAETFAAVAKSVGTKSPDVYNEASLYRAKALTMAKSFDEATKLLEQLIEKANSDAMRAAAHNALGDCYMAQNKVKEARYEYLRTVVLYFQEYDEYAKALYNAAICCEMLKDVKKASKLKGILKRECAESEWAARLEADEKAKKAAAKKAPAAK